MFVLIRSMSRLDGSLADLRLCEAPEIVDSAGARR